MPAAASYPSSPETREGSDSRDLITISIPTFRRPSLLLHALQSCFVQDYRPLEVDIGDDSPGPETERLIQSLSVPLDISLRYFWNRPGLGQVGNVNDLFSRARGTRLVLLHDDDVLLPGAVTALNQTFSLSDTVITAYGIQEVITDRGEVSASETRANNEHANRLPAFTGLQSEPVVCALWRQFPNDGYLIDTAIARKIGYRDVSVVGNANDSDFALRLALAHRDRAFYFLDRCTSQYRLSNESIRSQHDTCRKMYGVLEQLPLTSDAERRARDWLLAKIAEEAVVDHALHGEWKSALRIMRSKHYPPTVMSMKSLFHLTIVALPRLYRARAIRQIFQSHGAIWSGA